MGSSDDAALLATLARAAATWRQRSTPTILGGAWRAVQTVARGEWLAAEHLRRAGAIVFLPHRMASVRHGRRVIGVARALFPGYVLARLGDGDMAAAHSADGVVQVVRFGEAYAVLGEEAVDILIARCDANGCWREDVPRAALGQGEVVTWAVGEVVRITGGPFVAMTGVVRTVDGMRGIGVDIDIFGRLTPVTVSADGVEAVKEPPRSRERRTRAKRQ